MSGLDLRFGLRHLVESRRLLTAREADSSDGWLMRLVPHADGLPQATVHEYLEPDVSYLVARNGHALFEYFEYATDQLPDGLYATTVGFGRTLEGEAVIRLQGGAVLEVTTDPREAARWVALEASRPPRGMEALALATSAPALAR